MEVAPYTYNFTKNFIKKMFLKHSIFQVSFMNKCLFKTKYQFWRFIIYHIIIS